jgi:hypothetical protein
MVAQFFVKKYYYGGFELFGKFCIFPHFNIISKYLLILVEIRGVTLFLLQTLEQH